MKVRLGFVSNSSSSSFIGIVFYEKDAKFPDWYKESKNKYIEENQDKLEEMNDFCIDAENEIWGVALCTWDSELEKPYIIESKDIVNATEKIIKFCKDYDIQLDEGKLKICADTVYN